MLAGEEVRGSSNAGRGGGGGRADAEHEEAMVRRLTELINELALRDKA